ncbi:MAG: hypothetical protein AAF726_01455 [Planctomycetota bacterium]
MLSTLLCVSALLPLPLPLQRASAPAERPYVVLTAVDERDPFHAAARALADAYGAEIHALDPDDLEPLREVLRAAAPANVAIVLRPEQLDFSLGRRFLQLATEIDDDPFVDFAFGYITGRTGKDALRLAEAGIERKPLERAPKLATVAGGVDRSTKFSRRVPLRDETLSSTTIHCAGESAFPDEGRDIKFVKKSLRQLRGKVDALTFVGHGYPDQVVGGPNATDLRDARLKDAVVFNVACYTGVTSKWFESDYAAGEERLRVVKPEESFALAVLDAGVVGYTAYLCPRPAGPELDCDRAALIADGLSLGEARRRDYDKTVLGYLGFGEPRMQLAPITDGTELVRGGDVVRNVMLEGATGGVLFGDPACVPFALREGESPVLVESSPDGDELVVRASAKAHSLFLHCSDPTSQMEGSMALKVHARVPIGALPVADVIVEELTVGGEALETRTLWAVETDGPDRYLQLRVNFPRGQNRFGDMQMVARIVAAQGDEEGRERGGETVTPEGPVVGQAPVSLEERAAARDVGAEALAAAQEASAAIGPSPDATIPPGAVERLGRFESEGFRAVCVLLDAGKTHYRTVDLLAATWQPGDESHLLELAAGPELPNFASWAVLEGLGVADTPRVRRALLERLELEENAGLYMASAKGLARLRETKAVALIGDRLLEAREGWSGVAPHLVIALRTIGGSEAREMLERIADVGDERTRVLAENALQQMEKR